MDLDNIRRSLRSDKVTVRKQGRNDCENLLVKDTSALVSNAVGTMSFIEGLMEYEVKEIDACEKKGKPVGVDIAEFFKKMIRYFLKYGQTKSVKLRNLVDHILKRLDDNSLPVSYKECHRLALVDILEPKNCHSLQFESGDRSTGSYKVFVYLQSIMVDKRHIGEPTNLRLLRLICRSLFCENYSREPTEVFRALLKWFNKLIHFALEEVSVQTALASTLADCVTFFISFQNTNLLLEFQDTCADLFYLVVKQVTVTQLRDTHRDNYLKYLRAMLHMCADANWSLDSPIASLEPVSRGVTKMVDVFLSHEYLRNLAVFAHNNLYSGAANTRSNSTGGSSSNMGVSSNGSSSGNIGAGVSGTASTIGASSSRAGGGGSGSSSRILSRGNALVRSLEDPRVHINYEVVAMFCVTEQLRVHSNSTYHTSVSSSSSSSSSSNSNKRRRVVSNTPLTSADSSGRSSSSFLPVVEKRCAVNSVFDMLANLLSPNGSTNHTSRGNINRSNIDMGLVRNAGNQRLGTNTTSSNMSLNTLASSASSTSTFSMVGGVQGGGGVGRSATPLTFVGVLPSISSAGGTGTGGGGVGVGTGPDASAGGSNSAVNAHVLRHQRHTLLESLLHLTAALCRLYPAGQFLFVGYESWLLPTAAGASAATTTSGTTIGSVTAASHSICVLYEWLKMLSQHLTQQVEVSASKDSQMIYYVLIALREMTIVSRNMLDRYSTFTSSSAVKAARSKCIQEWTRIFVLLSELRQYSAFAGYGPSSSSSGRSGGNNNYSSNTNSSGVSATSTGAGSTLAAALASAGPSPAITLHKAAMAEVQLQVLDRIVSNQLLSADVADDLIANCWSMVEVYDPSGAVTFMTPTILRLFTTLIRDSAKRTHVPTSLFAAYMSPCVQIANLHFKIKTYHEQQQQQQLQYEQQCESEFVVDGGCDNTTLADILLVARLNGQQLGVMSCTSTANHNEDEEGFINGHGSSTSSFSLPATSLSFEEQHLSPHQRGDLQGVTFLVLWLHDALCGSGKLMQLLLQVVKQQFLYLHSSLSCDDATGGYAENADALNGGAYGGGGGGGGDGTQLHYQTQQQTQQQFPTTQQQISTNVSSCASYGINDFFEISSLIDSLLWSSVGGAILPSNSGGSSLNRSFAQYAHKCSCWRSVFITDPFLPDTTLNKMHWLQFPAGVKQFGTSSASEWGPGADNNNNNMNNSPRSLSFCAGCAQRHTHHIQWSSSACGPVNSNTTTAILSSVQVLQTALESIEVLHNRLLESKRAVFDTPAPLSSSSSSVSTISPVQIEAQFNNWVSVSLHVLSALLSLADISLLLVESANNSSGGNDSDGDIAQENHQQQQVLTKNQLLTSELFVRVMSNVLSLFSEHISLLLLRGLSRLKPILLAEISMALSTFAFRVKSVLSHKEIDRMIYIHSKPLDATITTKGATATTASSQRKEQELQRQSLLSSFRRLDSRRRSTRAALYSLLPIVQAIALKKVKPSAHFENRSFDGSMNCASDGGVGVIPHLSGTQRTLAPRSQSQATIDRRATRGNKVYLNEDSVEKIVDQDNDDFLDDDSVPALLVSSTSNKGGRRRRRSAVTTTTSNSGGCGEGDGAGAASAGGVFNFTSSSSSSTTSRSTSSNKRKAPLIGLEIRDTRDDDDDDDCDDDFGDISYNNGSSSSSSQKQQKRQDHHQSGIGFAGGDAAVSSSGGAGNNLNNVLNFSPELLQTFVSLSDAVLSLCASTLVSATVRGRKATASSGSNRRNNNSANSDQQGPQIEEQEEEEEEETYLCAQKALSLLSEEAVMGLDPDGGGGGGRGFGSGARGASVSSVMQPLITGSETYLLLLERWSAHHDCKAIVEHIDALAWHEEWGPLGYLKVLHILYILTRRESFWLKYGSNGDNCGGDSNSASSTVQYVAHMIFLESEQVLQRYPASMWQIRLMQVEITANVMRHSLVLDAQTKRAVTPLFLDAVADRDARVRACAVRHVPLLLKHFKNSEKIYEGLLDATNVHVASSSSFSLDAAAVAAAAAVISGNHQGRQLTEAGNQGLDDVDEEGEEEEVPEEEEEKNHHPLMVVTAVEVLVRLASCAAAPISPSSAAATATCGSHTTPTAAYAAVTFTEQHRHSFQKLIMPRALYDIIALCCGEARFQEMSCTGTGFSASATAEDVQDEIQGGAGMADTTGGVLVNFRHLLVRSLEQLRLLFGYDTTALFLNDFYPYLIRRWVQDCAAATLVAPMTAGSAIGISDGGGNSLSSPKFMLRDFPFHLVAQPTHAHPMSMRINPLGEWSSVLLPAIALVTSSKSRWNLLVELVKSVGSTGGADNRVDDKADDDDDDDELGTTEVTDRDVAALLAEHAHTLKALEISLHHKAEVKTLQCDNISVATTIAAAECSTRANAELAGNLVVPLTSKDLFADPAGQPANVVSSSSSFVTRATFTIEKGSVDTQQRMGRQCMRNAKLLKEFVQRNLSDVECASRLKANISSVVREIFLGPTTRCEGPWVPCAAQHATLPSAPTVPIGCQDNGYEKRWRRHKRLCDDFTFQALQCELSAALLYTARLWITLGSSSSSSRGSSTTTKTKIASSSSTSTGDGCISEEQESNRSAVEALLNASNSCDLLASLRCRLLETRSEMVALSVLAAVNVIITQHCKPLPRVLSDGVLVIVRQALNRFPTLLCVSCATLFGLSSAICFDDDENGLDGNARKHRRYELSSAKDNHCLDAVEDLFSELVVISAALHKLQSSSVGAADSDSSDGDDGEFVLALLSGLFSHFAATKTITAATTSSSSSTTAASLSPSCDNSQALGWKEEISVAQGCLSACLHIVVDYCEQESLTLLLERCLPLPTEGLFAECLSVEIEQKLDTTNATISANIAASLSGDKHQRSQQQLALKVRDFVASVKRRVCGEGETPVSVLWLQLATLRSLWASNDGEHRQQQQQQPNGQANMPRDTFDSSSDSDGYVVSPSSSSSVWTYLDTELVGQFLSALMALCTDSIAGQDVTDDDDHDDAYENRALRSSCWIDEAAHCSREVFSCLERVTVRILGAMGPPDILSLQHTVFPASLWHPIKTAEYHIDTMKVFMVQILHRLLWQSTANSTVASVALRSLNADPNTLSFREAICGGGGVGGSISTEDPSLQHLLEVMDMYTVPTQSTSRGTNSNSNSQSSAKTSSSSSPIWFALDRRVWSTLGKSYEQWVTTLVHCLIRDCYSSSFKPAGMNSRNSRYDPTISSSSSSGSNAKKGAADQTQPTSHSQRSHSGSGAGAAAAAAVSLQGKSTFFCHFESAVSHSAQLAETILPALLYDLLHDNESASSSVRSTISQLITEELLSAERCGIPRAGRLACDIIIFLLRQDLREFDVMFSQKSAASRSGGTSAAAAAVGSRTAPSRGVSLPVQGSFKTSSQAGWTLPFHCCGLEIDYFFASKAANRYNCVCAALLFAELADEYPRADAEAAAACAALVRQRCDENGMVGTELKTYGSNNKTSASSSKAAAASMRPPNNEDYVAITAVNRVRSSPAFNSLLLPIYKGLHDPDAIYAVDFSSSLSQQAVLYAHRCSWAEALATYDSLAQQQQQQHGQGHGQQGQVIHQGITQALAGLGARHTLSAYQQQQYYNNNQQQQYGDGFLGGDGFDALHQWSLPSMLLETETAVGRLGTGTGTITSSSGGDIDIDVVGSSSSSSSSRAIHRMMGVHGAAGTEHMADTYTSASSVSSRDRVQAGIAAALRDLAVRDVSAVISVRPGGGGGAGKVGEAGEGGVGLDASGCTAMPAYSFTAGPRLSAASSCVVRSILRRVGEETAQNVIQDLVQAQQLTEVVECAALIHSSQQQQQQHDNNYGAGKSSTNDNSRVNPLLRSWRKRAVEGSRLHLTPSASSLLNLRADMTDTLLSLGVISPFRVVDMLGDIQAAATGREGSHAVSPILYRVWQSICHNVNTQLNKRKSSNIFNGMSRALNGHGHAAASASGHNSANSGDLDDEITLLNAKWTFIECKLLWRKGLRDMSVSNLDRKVTRPLRILLEKPIFKQLPATVLPSSSSRTAAGQSGGGAIADTDDAWLEDDALNNQHGDGQTTNVSSSSSSLGRVQMRDEVSNLLSRAYRVGGDWLSASQRRSGGGMGSVLDDFLRPAVDCAVGLKERIEAHKALGNYCARLYQHMLAKINSVEWKQAGRVLADRVIEFEECKEANIAEHARLDAYMVATGRAPNNPKNAAGAKAAATASHKRGSTAVGSSNVAGSAEGGAPPQQPGVDNNLPANDDEANQLIKDIKILSRHAGLLKKEIDIDTKERVAVEESVNTYLLTAFDHFSHVLALSPEADVDVVFLLVHLWLSNAHLYAANEAMERVALQSSPSFKFVALTYQVLSRLGSSSSSSSSSALDSMTAAAINSRKPSASAKGHKSTASAVHSDMENAPIGQQASNFQPVLSKLVLRLCSEHPFHTLPQLFALAHEGEMGAAFDGAAQFRDNTENIKTSRSAAAAAIVEQLKRSSASSGIASENSRYSGNGSGNKRASSSSSTAASSTSNDQHRCALVDATQCMLLAYIELAKASTEVVQKEGRTKDIKFGRIQPRGRRFNESLQSLSQYSALASFSGGVSSSALPRRQQLTASMPAVLTVQCKLSPSCSYSEVPRVYSFSSTFSITDHGISRPKIVSCIGSDGKRYKQLVKGGDDMRQDAVMQQVFDNVNYTLSRDAESRKRNLSIRTYKIVPTTPQTGVLHWVDNTAPFGAVLCDREKGVHNRYYPNDWSHSRCREHLKDVTDNADKELKFEEICNNFHPAFRFFFLENFSDPAEWVSRRLAYTRSVAVSSIAGYILGIGDRHAHNILIDTVTAEVVQIDFGIVFEQGKALGTPETVPFRLTRDIVDGMGVAGCEGTFRRSCEETLRVLRAHAAQVLTILEVVIHDPLYKWNLSPLKARRRQLADADADADVADEAAAGGAAGRAEEEKKVASAVAATKRSNSLRKGGSGGVTAASVTATIAGDAAAAGGGGGAGGAGAAAGANFGKDAAERTLARINNKLHGLEDLTAGEALGVEAQVQVLISEARSATNLCKLFPGWAPWL